VITAVVPTSLAISSLTAEVSNLATSVSSALILSAIAVWSFFNFSISAFFSASDPAAGLPPQDARVMWL
jgi:hypothetical protein